MVDISEQQQDGLPRSGRAAIRSVTARVWFSSIALVAAAAIGVALVFSWVSAERDRAVRAWQDKLVIVAESRAAAVATA